MKKIKNKFIIGVILLTILISSFQAYKYYNIYKTDTNSYVLLVQGEGLLNNSDLYEDERKIINTGDSIKTIGTGSIAVLEWGDGSITRLGGNTNIKINENFISQDLTRINVSFNLLNGKTWSNVINFMGQESYFREYFNDIEAGVRGTIFDVDLINDYIFVKSHEVTLKGEDGKIYILKENKPFSLKTFSFVELQEYILNYRDKAWENLNNKLDNDFLNALKINLQEKFDTSNISKLLSKANSISLEGIENKEVYSELLSEYQKLNLVDSSSSELFELKLKLKGTLLKIAPTNEKENLVNSLMYDLEDIIKNNSADKLGFMLDILENNKLAFQKINFSTLFSEYGLTTEMKEALEKNISILKNIFGDGFKINELFIKDISDKTGKILDTSTDIKNGVDNLIKGAIKKEAGKIQDSYKNFIK